MKVEIRLCIYTTFDNFCYCRLCLSKLIFHFCMCTQRGTDNITTSHPHNEVMGRGSFGHGFTKSLDNMIERSNINLGLIPFPKLQKLEVKVILNKSVLQGLLIKGIKKTANRVFSNSV